MRLNDWEIKGNIAFLTYNDGEVVKMTKEKFNQAFGAIISVKKEIVKKDFAEYLIP